MRYSIEMDLVIEAVDLLAAEIEAEFLAAALNSFTYVKSAEAGTVVEYREPEPLALRSAPEY